MFRECLIMACHYHPERESTDKCAICGKPICKECGLEIAGKIYCKDCLQKIVGIGLDETAESQPAQEPVMTEAETYSQPTENIYAPKEEVAYVQEETVSQEYQKINDDSPYNIKSNIGSGNLESSYLHEETPQPAEVEYVEEKIDVNAANSEEFIYPDHSYDPEPTSARLDLEDKYEKYLDDLYFDEVPLEEQLAKDEEKFGSLTKKPKKAKKPKETPIADKNAAKPQRPETPEEMEARIRSEILKEMGGDSQIDDNGEKSIHNLNYQEEKEPMGVVDIILTIILIIVILIVIYYLIYLFILHNSYPTFMDAVFGLTNPQNVINNLLSSPK